MDDSLKTNAEICPTTEDASKEGLDHRRKGSFKEWITTPMRKFSHRRSSLRQSPNNHKHKDDKATIAAVASAAAATITAIEHIPQQQPHSQQPQQPQRPQQPQHLQQQSQQQNNFTEIDISPQPATRNLQKFENENIKIKIHTTNNNNVIIKNAKSSSTESSTISDLLTSISDAINTISNCTVTSSSTGKHNETDVDAEDFCDTYVAADVNRVNSPAQKGEKINKKILHDSLTTTLTTSATITETASTATTTTKTTITTTAMPTVTLDGRVEDLENNNVELISALNAKEELSQFTAGKDDPNKSNNNNKNNNTNNKNNSSNNNNVTSKNTNSGSGNNKINDLINYEKDDGEKEDEEDNLEKNEVEKGLKEKALEKRRYVIEELVETERHYVRDLGIVVKDYKEGLDNMSLPVGLEGKQMIVFGNVQQIHEWHEMTFLKELEKCLANHDAVGCVFNKYGRRLHMYVKYCENKPKSEYLVAENVEFFEELRQKLGHRLQLSDLLIKPIQRIMKYQLLLKDITKYTGKAGCDKTSLNKALELMNVIPKAANDMMMVGRLQGFEGKITAQGKLLLQESLMVCETKGDKVVLKERRVFLFEQVVIFAEVIERKKAMLSDSYIFKGSIMVTKLAMEALPNQCDLQEHTTSSTNSSSHDSNLCNCGLGTCPCSTTCSPGGCSCLRFVLVNKAKITPDARVLCQARNVETYYTWLNQIQALLDQQGDLLKALQFPIAYQKGLTTERLKMNKNKNHKDHVMKTCYKKLRANRP